ncbi:hypothetical protein LINPERHAP2_LOCUS27429 [Linum perenne]
MGARRLLTSALLRNLLEAELFKRTTSLPVNGAVRIHRWLFSQLYVSLLPTTISSIVPVKYLPGT